MYDLINYSKVPLATKINENKSNNQRVQNVYYG